MCDGIWANPGIRGQMPSHDTTYDQTTDHCFRFFHASHSLLHIFDLLLFFAGIFKNKLTFDKKAKEKPKNFKVPGLIPAMWNGENFQCPAMF